MSMRWAPLLFGVSLLAGCSGPECDSDGLTSALAQAESGDVVRIGACRIAGQFTLPAGAALEGEDGSTIEGKVSLSGGGRVESVAIESNAQAIVAKEGGDVVIRDVRVTASKGIGIAVDGVASLVMERVEIRGPVDASNVGALAGSVPDPMRTA